MDQPRHIGSRKTALTCAAALIAGAGLYAAAPAAMAQDLSTSTIGHSRAYPVLLAQNGPPISATPVPTGPNGGPVPTAAPEAASSGAPGGRGGARSAVGQPATGRAMRTLMQTLVKHGSLSQEEADAVMAEEDADLASARAQAAAPLAPAPGVEPVQTASGVVRVPYVPEDVREDIEKQVRQEVVQQAKDERWALPNTFPSWVSRITPFGDFRFRDESHFFDKGNFYGFVNGNSFNTSGPINYNNGYPILNSEKDRNLLQIRARMGFSAEITDNISTTFMIATGNDNGPISTIQTLGNDFGKKNLWLDQAYLTWAYMPDSWIKLGRFPNPFRSTEVLFKQDDFQLDGMAASFAHAVPGVNGIKSYLTLGAFPIEYATDDFPTDATADLKVADKEKWMFGGQAGVDYDLASNLRVNLNAGYYDFENVQGEPSTCQYTDLYCFTDLSRPGYLQKGNTLIYLRPDNATPDGLAGAQYLGLASQFRELDLLGRVDFSVNDRMHVILTGDYVKNLAFNANAIVQHAGGIGNLATNDETCVLPAGASLPPSGVCSDAGGSNVFRSGDTAWLARLTVGQPIIRERWDWSLSAAYLHIDPDAVMDAFDDKDFRLGGTNSKGYVLEGDLGLAHNTFMAVKYLSADAVYGPPLSVDVLQVDLNARF